VPVFFETQCSFAHLTLILLLHYLVKCKSRSLGVYNNEIILDKFRKLLRLQIIKNLLTIQHQLYTF